ncbi:hypothetical protein BaRGS_00038662, partial [Batillaria attramentaria]
DASLGGGVQDVTEPVQHCVMDLVRETMETDVSAVRVTSLLHFVLRVRLDIMVSSVINSVVTTVCLTITGENLALRPVDADAGQNFSGHSVKLSVGTGVSPTPATDKMAPVPAMRFGLLQTAQWVKTVITGQRRSNLMLAVVLLSDDLSVDFIKSETHHLMTHAGIFNTECRDGYYGAETCRPCGHCTNNTFCENNDGHCPDGCDDGYDGDLCDVQFSTDNAMLSVVTQENKPETSDPESNYAPLENYENPDDIRPYSMLQTNRGRPTNINIQGDEDAVLYHNTGTTGDKTYM